MRSLDWSWTFTPRFSAVVVSVLTLSLGVGACGRSLASGAPPDAGGEPLGDGDAATLPTEGGLHDGPLIDAPLASKPSTDAASDVSCPATVLTKPLREVVLALQASIRSSGGPASGAYVEPSAVARDKFGATVARALSGDEHAACDLPPSYRVVLLDDATYGKTRLVAELDGLGSSAPALYFGAYARRVDLAATRALVIEAPHPVYDSSTDDEAQDLFLRGYARYLLLAGAHRCASVDPSPCSGSTTACGARAPFRVSDPAHATAHPFFAVHRELSADQTVHFLQLHGNAASCPDALVSGASDSFPSTGFVSTFATALESEGIGVGRCGEGYPAPGCDLCGSTNVEGRLTAGSGNACTLPGSSDARFVHLEQLAVLRRRAPDGTPSWGPVLAAIEATLPR